MGRWGNWRAILAVALATMLGAQGATFHDPFDISPRKYDDLANRALMQVGSDLRFNLQGCGKGEILECRFSTRHVTARVRGRMQPSHVERIVLEADLLQDKAEADPVTVVTNIVLVLGATIVIVDPRLPAERRVQLLSDLTNTALDSGRSEESGMDAKYAATFDESASGLMTITVVPAK